MLYRIADLNLRLEGFESKYFERRMSSYRAENNCSVADISVNFKENNSILVPAGNDFRRFDAWYWIDRGEEGYTAIKQLSQHLANMMRIDIDRECKNVVIEYVDIKDYFVDVTTDYMLYYALNDAFAFCQTVRNAMLLHSASVSYKGNAVLFSAPSETGKSTHTGLWKKYYSDDVSLFNDDTPVIRKTDDSFVAYGTPWSGKTEINLNIKAPLRGIVFLKQAPENTIRRLSPIEAAINLLNQTRKPAFETLMDKHMDFINDLISNTPIYELGCTISREAVDLVKDTIFGE